MAKAFSAREVEKAEGAMQREANRLFGKDSEGDARVEVRLIDRTRYEPFAFEPVLYRHKDRKGQDVEPLQADSAVVEERQRVMQMNLGVAYRELETESKIVESHRERLRFAASPAGRKLILAHRRFEHNVGFGTRGCPICDGVIPVEPGDKS
jgi:hypothetical protein